MTWDTLQQIAGSLCCLSLRELKASVLGPCELSAIRALASGFPGLKFLDLFIDDDENIEAIGPSRSGLVGYNSKDRTIQRSNFLNSILYKDCHLLCLGISTTKLTIRHSFADLL